MASDVLVQGATVKFPWSSNALHRVHGTHTVSENLEHGTFCQNPGSHAVQGRHSASSEAVAIRRVAELMVALSSHAAALMK